MMAVGSLIMAESLALRLGWGAENLAQRSICVGLCSLLFSQWQALAPLLKRLPAVAGRVLHLLLNWLEALIKPQRPEHWREVPTIDLAAELVFDAGVL